MSAPPPGGIENGNFESGDFTGWIADPNWCVDRNTCGEYRGWEGTSFAWSGGKGEAAESHEVDGFTERAECGD